MLCQWIFMNIQDSLIKKDMQLKILPEIGELRWHCNLSAKDVNILVLECFWRYVAKAFAEVNYHNPTNCTEIQEQVIWYNTHIRVDNKPFILKKWFQAGVIKIENLLDDEHQNFLSVEQICEKYELVLSENPCRRCFEFSVSV